MSGDYSRIAFDPWLDDLGVLLEQGRPLTDRDWNDQALQLNRRIQAGTLDTLGAAVVPIQTSDGFQVLAAAGELTIGRGRIYVDGLLAENHGQAPQGGTLDWDPRLAELFGSEPVNYLQQPYYPNPPAVPPSGTHVAYVDVWQREITRYIRPDVVEPALGVDTSTRLQTVWQVKLLPAADGATCATPLDQFPGWLPDHAPSAGRLTVTTAPVPGQPDPCQVPPAAGYKGLENQLYRVEIHQGGAPGVATFKWSRDNASVEAVVTEIPSLTQLVVDSIGKDDVLRFSDGDWIEIADDWLELHGQPGLLRRIATGGGVDDATRTIVLDQALPPGQFPTDPQHRPEPIRHTRIRRWDQKRKILDAAGVEIQDLDAQMSDGTITVPGGATQILLEHNIVVSFSTQPTTGFFRSGDFWVFTARSREAVVEELEAAPPRGIHHHYAKLAIITLPDTEVDCRVMWPPSQAPVEAEPCACSVCVTPESHSSGTLTVQQAIDQVLARGGGTVCLDVGTYAIEETLVIHEAQSLRLVGQGLATHLQSTTRTIQIDESQDVALESLAVVCRPTSQGLDAAVTLSNSSDIVFDHVSVRVVNQNPEWSALDLRGALVGVSLRDGEFSAAVGIRGADPTGGQTGLTDVRVDDNTFQCTAIGIQLSGVTIHQFVSRIRGNRIAGCSNAGIELTGATVPGFGVEVTGNVLNVQGSGIVATLDGLRVIENDILRQAGPASGPQDGVRLQAGLANDEGLTHVQLLGNRVSGFGGAAVRVTAPRVNELMIKQNRLEQSGNGIVFDAPQALEQVAIENNQLAVIRGAAILADGATATLTTSANQIDTTGAAPAVSLLFARGESVFTGNQCSRRGVPGSADVLLRAGTVIAASNRVLESPSSIDITAGDRHFTVLGNICRGRITVNGSALAAPWAPLNLQNVT